MGNSSDGSEQFPGFRLNDEILDAVKSFHRLNNMIGEKALAYEHFINSLDTTKIARAVEAFNTIAQVHFDFIKKIDKIYENIEPLIIEFVAVSSRFEEFTRTNFEKVDWDKLNEIANDLVLLEESEYPTTDVQEVESTFDSALVSAGIFTDEIRDHTQFNKLLNYLKTLPKKSRSFRIVGGVLIWFVSNFVYDYLGASILTDDHTTITREITNYQQIATDFSDVKNISNNSSVIYFADDESSEVLHELSKQDMVIVLERNEKWSKILYLDVDNLIEGWIKSRYLDDDEI
ncbi:SH3 domain-containing protein [Salisediminibacterium beveridgei]|uniref:SH3 domain-containing protein n=1 Tax=Salisediminibacterium beveridgei TaxID=632773 RepID=A0A1D7QSW7_9BACI|nr:SH3 domain-containing protein [Salisediminibacterium beveridgei]AOM82071.1 hypothetical protein BBEV_0699 [Salisediminibacterium beveridgei]